jgi:DNA-binding protein HU-beta
MLEAIAGRGAAATAGGRATTGPAGGLAAMAGGAIICGAWRGRGTMRRGAGRSGAVRSAAGRSGAERSTGLGSDSAGGGVACGGAATTGAETGAAAGGALGTAGAATAGALATAGAAARTGGTAATTGREAGAAATTGRGGAAAASCRSLIARSTSPGFETLDRSMLGRASGSARRAGALPDLPPRFSDARTRSASASSRELECVFFSVTPTASSTSRIALLFTSSSRAKSLIRTLLIRPF